MFTRTLKIASFAVALAAGAAFSASIADAKPLGGGFGGGFKPGIGGGFNPGLGGGFKPMLPPGGFKPVLPPKLGDLKPFPPGGGIKLPPGFKPPVINPCLLPGGCKPPVNPKPPGHGGGHGKHWVWGGVTILAASYEGCGYEYYKWKSTGSKFWYGRYAECRGWY